MVKRKVNAKRYDVSIPPETRKQFLVHGRELVQRAVEKSRPPLLLNHYTTGDGFIGIMGRKTIWATNVGFMNDSQEFVEGLKLLRKAALGEITPHYSLEEDIATGRAKRGSPSDIVFATLVKYLNRELDRQSFNTFVVCFSANEDDLGQWRGYSGSSSKFSIGFDGRHLSGIADALTKAPDITAKRYQRCFLAPAIYESAKKKYLIQRMTMFIRHKFRTDAETLGHQKSPVFAMAWVEAYMKSGAMVLSLLKNQRFEGENEWRLVINRSSLADLNFRDRSSMLTPYLEIKLSGVKAVNNLTEKPTDHPIRKLWVGPSTHLAQNVVAAEMFIQRHDYSNFMVVPSTVPYRHL